MGGAREAAQPPTVPRMAPRQRRTHLSVSSARAALNTLGISFCHRPLGPMARNHGETD